MKARIFPLLASAVIGMLLGCAVGKPSEKQNASPQEDHTLAWLRGLWKVTPETTIKHPRGTLEPMFLLGDVTGDSTSLRGCFLWEGRFYDYWYLQRIEVVDSSDSLLMTFEDNGRFRGVIDRQSQRIRGVAYWDAADSTDSNALEFARADSSEMTRYFVPYPLDTNARAAYVYRIPECDEHTRTGSILRVVKDSTAFQRLMLRVIQQEFGRLESFLIVKDGAHVLEEYFYGFTRKQLHHINSCTKSIVSLLAGISLARHGKLDTDKPIVDFLPPCEATQDPDKRRITLEHVLTMTSGLPSDDDFVFNDADELAERILGQPLVSAPGETFTYNNNGTQLLGCLIAALEQRPVDEFAREVLFNTLVIAEYFWEKDHGVARCHNGLHLYPRDMAKIGLLVLNDGLWHGKRVVPKEWIRASTVPRVAESEFFNYGYQWWHRSKRNKSWWDEAVCGSTIEHDMILALGFGGQYIMIVPDLALVIVTTSSDNNEATGLAHKKVPMVIEDVVPLFE